MLFLYGCQIIVNKIKPEIGTSFLKKKKNTKNVQILRIQYYKQSLKVNKI